MSDNKLSKARNHHHFWIEDEQLHETYSTIRGLRFMNRFPVIGMEDCDYVDENGIEFIEQNFLQKPKEQIDINSCFYHRENEGMAKTFRDVSSNKWYYEHELIGLLGKDTVEKIKYMVTENHETTQVIELPTKNESISYIEHDTEEICGECYDRIGYYDVVKNVFQWFIDNDYVICKKDGSSKKV